MSAKRILEFVVLLGALLMRARAGGVGLRLLTAKLSLWSPGMVWTAATIGACKLGWCIRSSIEVRLDPNGGARRRNGFIT